MNNLKFKERVFGIVRQIPAGKTMSYSEAAKLAGNPKAYRAVGNIIHDSPSDVPCHQVVSKPGKLAVNFDKGGIEKQRELLEKGGVVIKKI
ncbi:cysteine methyltransferase [bacterium (Candidatus Howlettbacteria) CG_4_10_14_0_8_um_filter_40_9]|nr:MAG: cysteine methyltransferase [bacterium (Candidatus Howlettbacteria) CG_4_10_14_0_8_um_filter_40_9]